MRNLIKDFIRAEPRLLVISPTHKCTASCENCCIGCTPKITQVMDYDTIVRHIDEAFESFPNIGCVVFTGGECTLLGADLDRAIQYAAKHNVIVRIVTNAHWATTYDIAKKRIKRFIDAGLVEINFSTGDNHQQFIKFENIKNAIKASYDLHLKTIVVSTEIHPNSTFTSSSLSEDPEIGPLIRNKSVISIEASWMQFKKDSTSFQGESLARFTEKNKPCKDIFNSIVVHPNSQMLACCGLTVEYNPFLKLGDLHSKSMIELYNEQFNDLFKLWLYIEGPEVIYRKVMKKRDLSPLPQPHCCAYCLDLIRDQENIKAMKTILPQELPSIISHFKLSTTPLIIKD